MARTAVFLFLLAGLVGCRNTGGDREAGSAPRGFYTPFSKRGTEAPDAPLVSADGRETPRPIDEQLQRGRARYGISDRAETNDARQRYLNPTDHYGPTGR